MRRFSGLILGVLFFAGCTPPLNKEAAVTAVGEPTGATVTTTIGAAGGTVRSADGQLELIIPAGALAADTAMTVTPISVTAPGGVKAFRLGPEGTTFSQPATVKFTFTDEEAGGASAEDMRIAYQDAERRWAVTKDNVIEGKTISVKTTHLSDWSFVLGFSIRPAFAIVPAGGTIRLSVLFCGFPRDHNINIPHLYTCQDEEAVKARVSDWEVNSIPGGDDVVGTIQGYGTSVTYTAPNKSPTDQPSGVSVSVRFLNWEEGKTLLVSRITVIDGLPTTYNGAIDYHLKYGGTGTSTLPVEYRVTAPLKYTVSSSGGSYDLAEAPAKLVAFSKANGIPNCTCSASDIAGTLQADTRSLVLRNGVVEGIGFNAQFMVPVTCTGSSDPGCSNYMDFVAVAWGLTGQNPLCMNTMKATYNDPTHVNGDWSTKCPIDMSLLGREETVSWSLTGDR